MARRLLTLAGRRTWALALLVLALPSAANAQAADGRPKVTVTEPSAHRVYQRDRGGRATIPIVFETDVENATLTGFTVGGADLAGVRLEDNKLVGVPTGGPYEFGLIFAGPNGDRVGATVGPVFVGDLWILAGQSNMEGVGDLFDVEPGQPDVLLLGMDGRWRQAEEPLHWLVDSPDPVHSGNPKDRAERAAAQHKARSKGAGLGLPFGVTMAQQTGVPVGLVACAHGGTSLAQWSPEKKHEGGNSLYGSMLRQLKLAGDRFTGALWYQGESDAMSGAGEAYFKNFSAFIDAVRGDLRQSDLPFYFVQIGRFVHRGDPSGWNAVQAAQRRIPDRVPDTAVVSVIDLELDDAIHVGTQGLKRAGRRLARIALRELFGQSGATTPTLDRVIRGPNNTLIVKFKGVNMSVDRPVAAPLAGIPGGPARPGMAGPAPTMPGMGMMRGGMMGTGFALAPPASAAQAANVGLTPTRHIAGFSIRDEAGKDIPLIFEAGVGSARDTVVLKLAGAIPPRAFLWYGCGLDPYCNLVDGLDMAVPVFGPIALDEIVRAEAKTEESKSASSSRPIKVLIITGDNVGAHDWKGTTEKLTEILSAPGKVEVDATRTPARDLTDENLAKYDVLLLNYKDTNQGGDDTKWSDANKRAFLKAVHDEGKGLVVHHFASAAFTRPNWDEFERAIAGGWRSQGYHGPKHEFVVKRTDATHPIADGAPAKFDHVTDELYSNSKLFPGTVVLATAYSDPEKPRGTGKDEAVIWVNTYGKGRVYNNVLGHDVAAMSDKAYQEWLRRGVEWAATGEVKSSSH
jgi:type 1 glutamine amidotransferase